MSPLPPPALAECPWQPLEVRLPFGHRRISFGGTDRTLRDATSDPGPATRLAEHPEGRGAIPESLSRRSSGDHVLGETAEHDLGTPAARQFRYALWNLRPGLQAGSRRAAVTRARDRIAYLWVEVLGHPGRPLASVLGVRPQAGCQAVMRGRQGGARWEQVWQT